MVRFILTTQTPVKLFLTFPNSSLPSLSRAKVTSFSKHSLITAQAPGVVRSGKGLRRGPEKARAEALSLGSIVAVGGLPQWIVTAGAVIPHRVSPLGATLGELALQQPDCSLLLILRIVSRF